MSAPKSVLTAVLFCSVLMLPRISSASSDVDFSNTGGTLSGTVGAGLSLSGSMLIAVNGYNGGGLLTGNLGTVTFSTGALTGGSLNMGGTFDGGGSFSIGGNGTDGLNGTLFSGTFEAPVTWTLVTLANGTHNYTLTGVVSGSMGGITVQAVTVQLTINTGKGFFNGTTTIAGGDTSIAIGDNTLVNSVPEPSTLAMLGTGVISMVGMLRRRIIC